MKIPNLAKYLKVLESTKAIKSTIADLQPPAKLWIVMQQIHLYTGQDPCRFARFSIITPLSCLLRGPVLAI